MMDLEKLTDIEEENWKEHADRVNHPSHYTQGNIECIDAIAEATCKLKGEFAICTGNVIKYLWRWHSKNGVEDLKKARWYLDRLIAKLDA